MSSSGFAEDTRKLTGTGKYHFKDQEEEDEYEEYEDDFEDVSYHHRLSGHSMRTISRTTRTTGYRERGGSTTKLSSRRLSATTGGCLRSPSVSRSRSPSKPCSRVCRQSRLRKRDMKTRSGSSEINSELSSTTVSTIYLEGIDR